MTALGIVSDLIAGLHPDPLGNGSVLSLLLGEHSLNFERLVGRHDVADFGAGDQEKKKATQISSVQRRKLLRLQRKGMHTFSQLHRPPGWQ